MKKNMFDDGNWILFHQLLTEIATFAEKIVNPNGVSHNIHRNDNSIVFAFC
jgi:hypothetical protein